MSRWREAFLSLLLLSVIVAALPRLASEVRAAWELRRMNMTQRREAIMPGFYAAIRTLRREVPPDEPIAIIGTSRPSLDQAVFINDYLYPHPTRIFRDRWAWLMAGERQRPRILVRAADAHRTTYGELRADDLRHSRVVRQIALPAESRTRFIIPIVTSTDGPPPVSYTVEGALSAAEPARVTLTLEPAGTAKTLTLDGTRTFYDLVYECFGAMEFAAWMRVDSDRPVRAAFWLVNRAAKNAVPIRLTEGTLRSPAPFPVAPDPAILWLLNPADTYVMAKVGPHDALVPPRSLLSLHANGIVRGPVYAFLSEKLPDGSTRFTWPEDLH